MTDRYDYWRRVLNGERVPIQENEPQQGFYRMRQVKNGPWLPVAIWFDGPRDEAGNLDGDEQVIAKLETTIVEPASVWLSCAKHAVTYEAYQARMDTGEWPDQPPAPIGHNQAEEQSLADLIKDETERVKAWLKGRKILTQDEADKASNWSERIAKLGKKAEDERKLKKQPYWDAGLKVDAEYKPLKDAAANAVKALKTALTPFLQERERERLREAAKEAEKAPADEAPPTVAKTKAGGMGGRSTSLRTFVTAEITDYQKALKHFANHGDVQEVIQRLANAAAKAADAAKTDINIPGVKIKTERRAA